MKFPLTIISADCDDLKLINDKFGHATGDQYLKNTKSALKKALPKRALLFRMGGDEFLAIVPNTSKTQANKLLLNINSELNKFRNDKYELGVSIGSYTINKPEGSLEKAVSISDSEMYKNKKERKGNKE